MPQIMRPFDPTMMIGTTPFMVTDFLYDGLVNLGPKGMYPRLMAA